MTAGNAFVRVLFASALVLAFVGGEWRGRQAERDNRENQARRLEINRAQATGVDQPAIKVPPPEDPIWREAGGIPENFVWWKGDTIISVFPDGTVFVKSARMDDHGETGGAFYDAIKTAQRRRRETTEAKEFPDTIQWQGQLPGRFTHKPVAGESCP